MVDKYEDADPIESSDDDKIDCGNVPLDWLDDDVVKINVDGIRVQQIIRYF
jgi:hypothetical protein